MMTKIRYLPAEPAGRDVLFGTVRPTNGRVHAVARPPRASELRAIAGGGLAASANGAPGNGAASGPRVGDRYLDEYAPLFRHSQKMRALKEVVERVARTSATVLIRGESGAGKDIVARALHHASPRHGQPFVRVNCAAVPADLLESELFGHEKGAFTGACRRTVGKFEAANHGTFFLDEIGELPPALQAKLLHVLQHQEFWRVGGGAVIKVDVRVLAATNRDLEAAIRSGQFREDLYYRLNVIEVRVPPLRERTDEIPVLARFFLDEFNRQYERGMELPPETIGLFTAYSWPGNVRELENVVRRAVVLGNVQHIHAELMARREADLAKQPESRGASEARNPASGPDLPRGLREITRQATLEAERKAIREVLDQVHWNRAEAARILKVGYRTLRKKINGR